MKLARRVAAWAMVYIAGMATLVAAQVMLGVLIPIDFDGNLHPLYSFPGVVYPIAVLAIGGIAGLLYAD